VASGDCYDLVGLIGSFKRSKLSMPYGRNSEYREKEKPEKKKLLYLGTVLLRIFVHC